MDKLLVYEAMKDVLDESTEWGDNCKECGYYEFVSGVIYMANDLIKKIDDLKNNDNVLTTIDKNDANPTSEKVSADCLYDVATYNTEINVLA